MLRPFSASVSRLATVLLLLLLVAVLAGAAVAYLSWAPEALPRQVRVPGLTQNARLALSGAEGQPAALYADAPADGLRALGYAQSQEATWPLLLWRQMARSQMGAWLGTPALPLDRHAALLGLDENLDSVLALLQPATRAALDAFADGVNAGLVGGALRSRLATRLRIRPEPFTARDVLAIARLFAWCATPVARADSLAPSGEAQAFGRADSLFRRAAGLFGWEHSAAWTALDSAGTTLTLRWVTGNAALPVVHESVWFAGGDSTLLVTIPGTPFALLRAGQGAAARLPGGRALLAPATGRWRPRLTPLAGTRGATFVRRTWQAPGRVLLAADTSAKGASMLLWSGFQPPADEARLFDALLDAPSGPGVTVQPWPGADVPAVLYRRGELYTPDAPARPWLLARLDTLAATATPADAWWRDVKSTWAAGARNALMADLDPALLTTPNQRTAYDYLQNWNGLFEGASIGATVFEALAAREGLSPFGDARPDTVRYFAARRRTRALAAIADSLAARYGPDPLGWRWERVHAQQRLFPLWSVAGAPGLDLSPSPALAPIELPGDGRMTTLRWLDATPRGANATYVAVVRAGSQPVWLLHRLRLDLHQPFERYRVEGRRIEALRVAAPGAGAHLITLIPNTL